MSAIREQDRWPVIKWLAGIIGTIVLLWVSSLQAGQLRLSEADLRLAGVDTAIREQLASKSEVIAAHEIDLRDMRPRVIRIEEKLDRVLEYQRRAS